MLLYLDGETWESPDAPALAEHVAQAKRLGVHILLAHEMQGPLARMGHRLSGPIHQRDNSRRGRPLCGCDFSVILGATPLHLLNASLYEESAIPLKDGPFRPTSMALLAQALAARPRKPEACLVGPAPMASQGPTPPEGLLSPTSRDRLTRSSRDVSSSDPSSGSSNALLPRATNGRAEPFQLPAPAHRQRHLGRTSSVAQMVRDSTAHAREAPPSTRVKKAAVATRAAAARLEARAGASLPAPFVLPSPDGGGRRRQKGRTSSVAQMVQQTRSSAISTPPSLRCAPKASPGLRSVAARAEALTVSPLAMHPGGERAQRARHALEAAGPPANRNKGGAAAGAKRGRSPLPPAGSPGESRRHMRRTSSVAQMLQETRRSGHAREAPP